jgi:hypothetical protein
MLIKGVVKESKIMFTVRGHILHKPLHAMANQLQQLEA